ncbi:MAG: cytochrome C biogenesis protein, partial [Chitinophagaceae bacterium]
MKHIYLCLFFLLSAFQIVNAQDIPPAKVKWEFSAQKVSDTKFKLKFIGTVDKDWRVFSTTAKEDELNSRVVFDSASIANNEIGAVEEAGQIQTLKEPLLDNMEVKFHLDKIELDVPVTVKVSGKNIRGVVNYMVMKGDSVLGPTEAPFVFSIDGAGNISAKEGGLTASTEAAASLNRTNIDIKNPVNNCGGTGLEETESKSLW